MTFSLAPTRLMMSNQTTETNIVFYTWWYSYPNNLFFFSKESIVWVPSRDIHHLNWLQHVGNGDDKVTRFYHTSRLEQGECAVQVAFHVIWEAQAEGYETPLQIQAPSHRRCGCECKDRAVWAASRQKGGQVPRFRVNEKGINFQIISCKS